MTALQVYEAVLTELNKVKAPSLLLEDFNYFFNKEIIQYINKIYNTFEINQQKTDDLRVLQSSCVLNPLINQDNYPNTSTLYNNIYEVYLPDDYLHILNCVVEYKLLKKNNCNNIGDYIQIGAKKLKADNWSQIINNYYFKPKYNNPYFYINNNTTSINYPTEDNIVNINEVNKEQNNRYGNSSKVKMEIRIGKNNPAYELFKIYVDYLKTPKYILLTQEEIDDTTDNSQIIEFPDYVINEIINGLVSIILENNTNQRLQTQSVVNQSIK